jgi:hypothetical protein
MRAGAAPTGREPRPPHKPCGVLSRVMHAESLTIRWCVRRSRDFQMRRQDDAYDAGFANEPP